MTVPKRTIDELITQCELEPTLGSVFVEGDTDAWLLNWFFEEHGMSDVVAYSIDTVEVTDQDLERLCLSRGNRQEVLGLAAAFETRGSGARVACVYDLDLDGWLGIPPSPSPVAIRTDLVSLEFYAVQPTSLRRFARLLSLTDSALGQLLDELTPILQECFVMRVAHAREKLPLGWIAPRRCCSIKRGSSIRFDISEFLKRLLQGSGNWKHQETLKATMTRYRAKLTGDLHHESNFHDLVDLLSWYLTKHGFSWASDEAHLSTTLMSYADISALAVEPLFARLKSRFSTDTTKSGETD